MEIIGLKNSFRQLEELKSLPHSILLVGEQGSGKTLFANLIANKFLQVPLVDITEAISSDLLEEIYSTHTIQAYLIDLRKLRYTAQSKILKFLEEPNDNIYIIVVANSEEEILPTIESRLFSISLDDYSFEELREFADTNKINIDNAYLTTIIKTPGDILKVRDNNIDIKAVEDLVNKIIDKLGRVNISNALTIVDKLNYNDEYDKLDVNFFLSILYNTYIRTYIDTRENKYYKESNIVKSYIDKVQRGVYLNKKHLISSLILELWENENGVERTKRESK